MPSLPELQRDFARALRGEPPPALLRRIEPDGLGAAARLQVYTNHFRITLAEALAATFPVVARLLGEECFAQAARRFVRAHPPATPCLVEYGGRLPAFLGARPELAALPYLADVARLEWALNEARHAPEAPLPGRWPEPHRLPTPERLVFAVHPSVRFLASRWPVDQIWRANQPGVELDELRLEPRGVRLLIHRDAEGDVGWLPLPRPAFAFVRMLAAGHSLGRATDDARAVDPGFVPGPLVKALIEAEVLIDAVVLHTFAKELP